MAGRLLIFSAFVVLLSGCREGQLSLPVTHAAASQPAVPINPPAREEPLALAPKALPTDESCYSFILLRPKDQRAAAVQARLKQADKMSAGFNPGVVSVDLVGDHANILALQFPVTWPDTESYAVRISSLIEAYLSSQDVQDYLCNSGFSEVRLSARGVNDRRIHPIWTARVTTEGLLKNGE
jgi:hypothetical protein